MKIKRNWRRKKKVENGKCAICNDRECAQHIILECTANERIEIEVFK